MDFKEVISKLESVKGKISYKGLGIGAGITAALWLALSNKGQPARDATNSIFTSITQPFASRAEYISSSTLGMQGESDILGRVFDPKIADFARNKSSADVDRGRNIMGIGNYIHKAIQDDMVTRGIAVGTEAYVEDPTNKVFGYIDVMLPGGVPLEIKSIGESQFAKLSKPKEPHVSQANFYALANNSPTALVMYVSRADNSKRKVFAINADPGRYQRDIDTIRNVQAKTRGLARKNSNLSGFRPLRSWFGGGINYNMPNSQKSKYAGQRISLSGLPVSMHMAQSSSYNHPNSSRAGV